MKTTLIIFLVAFLFGIGLIVVLPLLLGGMPDAPGEVKEESKGPSLPVADQGVFRSDDGGKTWQSKAAIGAGRKTTAKFKINGIIIDPRDSNTLYLATGANGLYVSFDRAESWGKVQDQKGLVAPTANVLAFDVSPADNQQWLAAVFQQNRGRLLKSVDGGQTFKSIYLVPLERYGVFDIQVYDSQVIDIVTGQGGYLSTADGGRTWKVVRWFLDGLIKLEIDPTNVARRFVVSSRGNIFKTSDGGINWVDITPNFQSFRGATANQRLVLDSSGTIYLGSKYGLLRSGDQGASFQPVPIIIPPEALPILAIAVDPKNSSHLFVSAGSQIYETNDRGESWSILPSAGEGRVTHLIFDPRNSETVYAVVQP